MAGMNSWMAGLVCNEGEGHLGDRDDVEFRVIRGTQRVWEKRKFLVKFSGGLLSLRLSPRYVCGEQKKKEDSQAE